MARQHVDRGAAVQKVVSHLRGYVFWIGADPFLGDAVVRGEDEQEFPSEPRRDFSLDDGDAARQLFQFSQASLRFGQSVQTFLGGVFAGPIQGQDLLERLVQAHGCAFLTIIGIPATVRTTSSAVAAIC